MIQVRDAIECGEETDAAGNRWQKYQPGLTRIVDETDSRDDTARVALFTLAAFIAGAAWWWFVLSWIGW